MNNSEYFEKAKRFIPGGVNSPVRAFASVGGTPLFIASASGSKFTDVEGREYIDFVGSWGPMILGHAQPDVTRALQAACELGTSYGAPTPLEVALAEKIATLVPSMEKVRLVSSGTEATMSAIRLARGFTGRSKIIKFEGCYHGHADSFLIAAGSGLATLGVPNSPGVTAGTAQDTLVATYNDLDSVRMLFSKHGDDIAAVIVEPVAGNMGLVPPDEGFLPGLRAMCDGKNSLLIFDEIITGFRVALGGAQERYGIKPDITTLGKIIGGGLPVGAYGGRADIMQMISPDGPVYQAGTLSGNPLAVTAGLTTLSILSQSGVYDRLEEKAASLAQGMVDNLKSANLDLCITRVGSMLGHFFTKAPVRNWPDAKRSETKAYAMYFHGLLERGIYTAPSQFETLFVSLAHSEQDIQALLQAQREVLQAVRQSFPEL